MTITDNLRTLTPGKSITFPAVSSKEAQRIRSLVSYSYRLYWKANKLKPVCHWHDEDGVIEVSLKRITL